MPDRYELAAIHNDFGTAVLEVRNRLQAIADGERDTHRQVRHKEYGWLTEGKKKLTLKEAQQIARFAINRLNEAINEFDERTRDL